MQNILKEIFKYIIESTKKSATRIAVGLLVKRDEYRRSVGKETFFKDGSAG